MLSDLSRDDCSEERQQERRRVEPERNGRCEHMTVRMNHQEQVGDGDRMGEVDEVGVLPEELERAAREIFCSQPREERKERERRTNRIENAERRELMCRVDCLERRIAVRENQFVIPCEKRGETDDAEGIETPRMPCHQRAERVKMQGDVSAEQEDKDVVHDPVVQPIKQQRAQKRSLGEPVDVEIERRIEARPVVERDLQNEDACQQRQGHVAQEEAPKRHQQIEPDQDDHEIELILCIAEEENARQGEKRREARPVIPRVMHDVKERPDKIRNDDRTPAPREEISVGKHCGQRLPVEEAERRDKEKNRHAEARADVKKRHKMKIWRWICEILRADVNADHAHHGDAADRFDSGDSLVFIG